MTQLERLYQLNSFLLNEMPQYKKQALSVGKDEKNQFQLFRSLVNVRPPMPASFQFLKIQDEYLQAELRGKGITDIESLTAITEDLYLWQGDITTLKCGAVVNAANSQMLGCFCPCHGCIDNAIHTFAGIQLRLECDNLMKQQGHEEQTGQAKITPAFNLPSEFVIHTVGPIIQGKLKQSDCELLADCYRSCLSLAEKNGVTSIAFCCISTGEFHFPNEKAAEIAVRAVRNYKSQTQSKIKVVFNVFKDMDDEIYRKLFG